MRLLEGEQLAKVNRRVLFFDTVVETTDKSGKVATSRVDQDFWLRTLAKLEAITDHKKRIHRHSGRRFYGVVARPKSPPIHHIQIGRLRDLSDHLEQTDLSSGTVAPLTLGPNLRVSEPTFVVPFGLKGRVAIMSPGGSTRQETIASWLTGVLNLATSGKSVRFRPVVDEAALTRLVNSQGAVGVEFNLDAEEPIPSDTEVPILDAVEQVRKKGPSVGTITIGWTLGRDGGTISDRGLIKKLAQKIAEGGIAKRGKVNLVLDDGQGGVKREVHSLFEDQVVTKVSYEVEADVRTSSEIVLSAINDAISTFNQSHS
ncbi:hypothetical protein [Microbacterium sp. NPDC058389]|uniref:hypothetical protein n=1 Tax=Microbacterium sp. NPDC058389 TaxID=3346475 RepID=UPI00364C63FD